MGMIGRVRSQTADASKFVVDWMEHRTGIVTLTEHFLYEPVPKRGAWLYTLGSATLFLITLQFLTGILLLFYYVPSIEDAWNSVYYIQEEAYFGALIRGIHYWSANFLLAVIGLHMAQVFFSGGYKAPRELNWVVGVVLLLLVIVLAFTGYLLRWDQDGFWASVVGMKIGSYTPFVGGATIHFLLGGDVVGPATLSRFFALHVWLLPAALAPFIGIHLYLLRRHGVFGSEFEYTERLAKLHENQRLEEYARYELDEGEEEYEDGENGYGDDYGDRGDYEDRRS
jgi:quinol-cytochrome oxidoreductase complex cytochrome b subunit